MRKIILIIWILSAIYAASAQVVTNTNASKKALKYMENGISAVMQRNLEEAATQFEKAIAEEPDFIDAYLSAGDAYRQMNKDSIAIIYYQKAIDIQDDYDVGVYKKIAESEQKSGMYEEALAHINIFLEFPKIVGESRRNAERIKSACTFAIQAIKNPVQFTPVNLGKNVNSVFPEYFPSVSADNSVMVFTRKLNDTLVTPDGIEIPRGNEDFFITYFDKGEWSPAQNMGKPINTKFNEGAQNISPDGKSLFYTLCDGPDSYGSCDIYYSLKIGEQWSIPENGGNSINSADWDSQPSISSDGKFLYFSSTRPGGFGSYDIWVSEMDASGYWSEPVNLGPVINTSGAEQSPFIHPDGKTLYFSSDGHPGMGGTDLYYSKKSVDNNWSEPVNLGYPLNTNGNEATLFVTADGSTAYYASDRYNSLGELDLYSFVMPENLKPEPVTYVKATVLDERTNKPLKSSIQLIDLENGDILLTSNSDEKTGEFLVCLPIGKDYALYVNREGYLFHSENFSLNEATPQKPYLINILLSPVDVGEVITLKNIFFETASSALLPASQTELMKLDELLTKNPTVTISVNGHTDNIGTDADNLKLSVARALSVKNFLTEKGIADKRIQYKGYGETKPVDTNDTEQGRANNRRTEIEILSK